MICIITFTSDHHNVRSRFYRIRWTILDRIIFILNQSNVSVNYRYLWYDRRTGICEFLTGYQTFHGTNPINIRCIDLELNQTGSCTGLFISCQCDLTITNILVLPVSNGIILILCKGLTCYRYRTYIRSDLFSCICLILYCKRRIFNIWKWWCDRKVWCHTSCIISFKCNNNFSLITSIYIILIIYCIIFSGFQGYSIYNYSCYSRLKRLTIILIFRLCQCHLYGLWHIKWQHPICTCCSSCIIRICLCCDRKWIIVSNFCRTCRITDRIICTICSTS